MRKQQEQRPTVRQMMRPTEVAHRLALSRDTVNRMIHAGTLEAKRIGRQWRVYEDSVAAYQAEPVSGGGNHYGNH